VLSIKTAFVGTQTGTIKTFYRYDGRSNDRVIKFFKEVGLL